MLLPFLLSAFTFLRIQCGQITADLKTSNVTVKWDTDYQQQAVQFSFRIETSLPEILFVGFSKSGSLNNTDGLLYYPRKKIVKDVYIDRKYRINYDIQQDFKLIRLPNNYFVIRRKLVTCDSRDYAFQPGTTQFVIAGAWDTYNLISIKDPRWKKEKKFGKVVEENEEMEYASKEKVKLERDVKKIVVTTGNPNPIPATETNYQCIIHKMPIDTINNKYHIVKMEPYITPGNEHIVHHMEIFLCQQEVEEWSGNCNDPRKPRKAKSCSHVIAAWAMGEGPIYYPKEAGLPIGGNRRREYVMVEIHYNNPKLQSGVVDGSGFQFYVTPSLRTFDAGIMELGLIYSDANSIPPQQRAWAMNGYCPSQCTRNFPNSGINVFASQLHAHLTGKKLWTSQYRNGVKIGEINRNENYSPHWQHLQQIRPYIHVRPGDLLTTTCVYDTRDRSKVTFGGYGIRDEMCVNYIYYYPASDVEVCKSAISNSTLRSYFAQRYGMRNPTTPISKLYNGVKNWDQDVTEEFYNVLNSGDINVDCLQGNGQSFEFPSFTKQSWETMAKPQYYSGSFIKTRDQYECPSINDMVNFD